MGRERDEVMAKARAKRRQRQERRGQKLAADKEQGVGIGTQVRDAVVGAANLMKSAATVVTEAITGTESP